MSADGRSTKRVGVAWIVAAAGAATSLRVLYRQLVRGALTVDTGIGRRTIELGPLTEDIDAPREVVFEVVAAPYLGRAGPAAGHIDVWARGDDLVVAAHHTPIRPGLVATTLESVAFERPGRITFRLLRGPVPHVAEEFELEEVDGGTRLHYRGELGTDFWGAGAVWGHLVAKNWVQTVAASMQDVRQASETRAAAHRRRQT